VKKISLVILTVLFFSSGVFAGGFQTGTQNARAMGMGSAFVGMASDASAIYFNPAGLTNVKGLNILAGTTLIMPALDFTGPTPLTTKNSSVDRTFTPINFYAAYGMGNGFAFGVGVNNPYGLGTEWPATWIGKRLGVKTELRTFYITPTLSYQVSNNFSIGAGFSYIVSDVLFNQAADLPAIPLAPGVNLPAAPNVGINLEGDGDAAYTFVVGLLFKASDDVSFGVSYRHSAEINFNGDLTFKNLPAKPTGFPVGHSDLFPQGKGKASLTMPFDLRAGVSFNATKDLTFNADFMYVGWDSYKELAVDFEKNSAAWTDIKIPKNWENSIGIKVGGEYRMDQWAFRAGYVFDGSPIPTKYMDPTLPGSDRHEFTLGLGFQVTPSVRFDAAYQYISFTNEVKDSAIPFNGKYENSTNLFGFNLGFCL
jgi:long-chain fatty acid transport protein